MTVAQYWSHERESLTRPPPGSGPSSPTKRARPVLVALGRLAFISSEFKDDFVVASKCKKQQKGREWNPKNSPPECLPVLEAVTRLSEWSTWLTHEDLACMSAGTCT